MKSFDSVIIEQLTALVKANKLDKAVELLDNLPEFRQESVMNELSFELTMVLVSYKLNQAAKQAEENHCDCLACSTDDMPEETEEEEMDVENIPVELYATAVCVLLETQSIDEAFDFFTRIPEDKQEAVRELVTKRMESLIQEEEKKEKAEAKLPQAHQINADKYESIRNAQFKEEGHHVHKEPILAWVYGAEIEVNNQGVWERVAYPLWKPTEEYRVYTKPVDTSGVSVPWEYLNPIYKFVGKDCDGQWYAFANKPEYNAEIEDFNFAHLDEYTCIDDVVPELVTKQVPNFTIIERP